MKAGTRDGAAPTGEVHRLFFALWPDDVVRTRIAAAADLLKQHPHLRGRWLKPHRYHLTLQFLGDFSRMPEALATRACAAADRVAASAFALSLDCVGSFRKRSIPWWLGCSRIPQALSALWDQLAAAMRDSDIAYDTKLPLTPHVTVLRDSDVMLPSMPISPLSWPVEDFVLIHSFIGPQSRYRVLRRWPLGVPGPVAVHKF
jgi:2'-5' RNA ligase